METTKVQLSSDELRLMKNTEWILTKNSVIEKISHGFGELIIDMQNEVEKRRHVLDELIMASSPKISRGEKYQGLPYVMLDYPKFFQKEQILAFRTFFWWGNFCSITLHAKGRFVAVVAENMRRGGSSLDTSGIHPILKTLEESGFYISFSGDEWNHDLNSNDYKPLSSLMVNEFQNEEYKPAFVKVSAKIDFSQWDDMEKKIFEQFVLLLKLAELTPDPVKKIF